MSYLTSEDFELTIEYKIKEKKDIENIEHISMSNLGDVLATIDKLKTVKIFNENLNLLSHFKTEMIESLDYFKITNGKYFFTYYILTFLVLKLLANTNLL